LDSYSVQPFHIEGFDAGEWILMDYGDVIVHIFREEERQYYQLEKLWRNAHLVYSKELQANKFNEID
jgi:ribosome-associated protein